MFIRLLGAVEIASGSGWTRAGPAKRSCVLAALALSPGEPLSLETLTDRVWGTEAPSSAHGTLYGHIAHLRSVLKSSSEDVTIGRSGPGGYVLDVEPELIDVFTVRSLACRASEAAAAGDHLEAIAGWRRAQELLRVEVLAGIGGDWAAQVRSGFRREHCGMLTDLFTTELFLGRHRVIVEELSRLVANHPLAEGLVECLMIALYRCDRQAEALDCYAAARSRIADRLGADPSLSLQELHLRILKNDPGLLSPEASDPTVKEAEPPESTTPVLDQLPAVPRSFVGRSAPLAAMDETLTDQGPTRLLTVTGPGGIGKSWLVLHWAHRRRAHFTDGLFHVNLRGYDTTAEPMSSQEALHSLLESLGVQPAAIPTSPDAKSGLFRSLTADKRALMVLDNARDAEQVTPLLPNGDDCVTLVTSRHTMTALATAHGARALRLDTLDMNEARDALVHRLGAARVDAEPDAIAELIEQCGGLPLALGILAARVAAQPDVPLVALAGSFRDRSRLDALDSGDLTASLRAVLSTSVDALSPAAARAFALLGLAPGSHADRYAIASLTAASFAGTDVILRELESANLVERNAFDGYRMHDLTRLYASERAHSDFTVDERSGAVCRVVEHYLHTVVAAQRLVYPGEESVDLGNASHGCRPRSFADTDSAARWLDAEYGTVVSAQKLAHEQGWDAVARGLALGLTPYQNRRYLCEDGAWLWRRVAALAERDDDVHTQAKAERLSWKMRALVDGRDPKPGRLDQWIALAESRGDHRELAAIHLARAWIREMRGGVRDALPSAERAVEHSRRTEDGLLQAKALNQVGWLRAQLGECDAARGRCEEALRKARAIPADDVAASILDSLGYIAYHSGQCHEALSLYEQALEEFRRIGERGHEAWATEHLAEAHEKLGMRETATRLRVEAAELYRELGHTGKADALRR